MKRVNAIVQARMGSKRLPGKTLMPIAGRPMLELLLERLRYSKKINDIIVATSVNPEDDAIEKFCRDNGGIVCFRGSADDVLHRVHAAAKLYSTDIVVLVTGDCPLIDPRLIDKCVGIFLRAHYDYLSNFIDQSYPPGIDVQILTFDLLSEINRRARGAKFREHVTHYLFRHRENYRMRNVKAPDRLCRPDWHLEVDEMKDYELIKLIYENLYPKKPKFSTADVIQLLEKNPKWLDINRDVPRAWEALRCEVHHVPAHKRESI